MVTTTEPNPSAAPRSRIGLIGVPTSAGAHWPGQEQGPKALRDAGLAAALTGAGTLNDLGDLEVVAYEPDPAHRRAQNVAAVAGVARSVAKTFANAAGACDWTLVVGGDCTITIGVIAGLIESWPGRLGSVYFDGHLDLNTPATSASGILDSMGLTHLLGHGAPELTGLGSRFPLIGPEQVCLFGSNHEEANAAELETLRRHALRQHRLEAIRGRAAEAAAEARADLERVCDGFLVHLDVDVIDFVDFPGSDVPQFSPGLAFDEAIEALGVFIGAPSCLGLVVTEFNPDRDRNGALAKRLVAAIGRVLARPPTDDDRRG
jgi:arginase